MDCHGLRSKSACAGVLDAIDDDVQSRIFVASVNLQPEAIVEFLHALTTVSSEELSGRPTARVFMLSKIVDVCHHNINRPRIVWTGIWKGAHATGEEEQAWRGLSEYFVDIGCHATLQVAMYAMDALRQARSPTLACRAVLHISAARIALAADKGGRQGLSSRRLTQPATHQYNCRLRRSS